MPASGFMAVIDELKAGDGWVLMAHLLLQEAFVSGLHMVVGQCLDFVAMTRGGVRWLRSMVCMALP